MSRKRLRSRWRHSAALGTMAKWEGTDREIEIPMGSLRLEGRLTIPSRSDGIVLFVHGSGSSRHSTRNKFVADVLNQSRHATLLFDLLTQEEEEEERDSRHLRFDISLLAERLVHATDWVIDHPDTRDLKLGYFGASTGAAAALVAAASRPKEVYAVVSRGGRPDLAGIALSHVRAPTLLIVGGADSLVIPLNEEAFSRLSCVRDIQIVPGATHLFEEPGALDKVSHLASNWFDSYLRIQKHPSSRTG